MDKATARCCSVELVNSSEEDLLCDFEGHTSEARVESGHVVCKLPEVRRVKYM